MINLAILKPINKRDQGKPLPIKGRGELLVRFVADLGLNQDTV